jgi:hypothetical protein
MQTTAGGGGGGCGTSSVADGSHYQEDEKVRDWLRELSMPPPELSVAAVAARPATATINLNIADERSPGRHVSCL